MSNHSRAILEAAPERKDWKETTTYDSIYLLPSKKKHDSGYHLICIVGETKDGLEKAAYCDDICWHVEPGARTWSMRTDMTYPGGVAHHWGNRTKFRVGMSLSSTDVYVVDSEKE